MGYEFTHVDDEVNDIYNGTGTYTYDSLVNFVSDLLAPGHCSAGGAGVGFLPCYSYFRQTLGPSVFGFGANDYAAFASDEWKARPRLTLTYGVRYDFEQLPHTNSTLANAELPQTSNAPADRNNFGPRAGVAWDVFGHGGTVLRAGYGLYYGRIANATVFSAITGTGSPHGQRSYYFKPLDEGAPPFPHVFAGQVAVPVAPDVVYFDRRFQNPQIHEMELSLQQRIPGGTELTASFRESLGRELQTYVDTNIDLTAPQSITYSVADAASAGPLHGAYTTSFFTQRLNPRYQRILAIQSETNARYTAGVLRVSHRLRQTLHLQASYTYAHAIDFNQNERPFARRSAVLAPGDLRGEYGSSNFDVRQRVTGEAVLRAPWRAHGLLGALVNGYAAAPVVAIQTGLPFSMRTAGAVPSMKLVDELNRMQTLSGLGDSINGSGGARRIAAVGRNTFRYPGTLSTNLRLSKETRLGERTRVELQGEFFNLLNHQNVTNIDTVGYYISGASSATGEPKLTYNSAFGTVNNANSSALLRERQVQLGAKLRF